MTEQQQDREVIDLIDEFANEAPPNFFQRETTKETTTVRTMHFALKNIVEQLRQPISSEAEAVPKWLIYKQSGPHRHQKFFGYFRQMARLLNKYNDIGLVKRLNVVLRVSGAATQPQRNISIFNLKKMENCGDDLYKLEEAAIRYMGCAYLRRLYLLEQIRVACVKSASATMGMLELEHFTKLCLVLVAVCAEVHVEVVAQLVQMEKTYKTGARVFRTVDSRFPESLNDLEVVERLKRESGAFDDRKVDISAVSKLMKYSELKMEQAQMENEMRMRRNEVLNELLSSEMALDSPTQSSKTSQLSTPKIDLSDLGISISREELSFLNSTVQSCSNAPEEEAEEEDVLMSPNLFKMSTPKTSSVTKSVAKKKMLKSTLKIEKAKKSVKKQKKSSFLSSTMSLFDN